MDEKVKEKRIQLRNSHLTLRHAPEIILSQTSNLDLFLPFSRPFSKSVVFESVKINQEAMSHSFRASVSVNGGTKYRQRDRKARRHQKTFSYCKILWYLEEIVF
jgi:hypothetical protein